MFYFLGTWRVTSAMVSTDRKRIRSPGLADRHGNPARTRATMVASPSTRDVGLSTGAVSSLSSMPRFKQYIELDF